MMTKHVTPLYGTCAREKPMSNLNLHPGPQVCHTGGSLSHFLGLRKSPRSILLRLVADEAVKAPCLEASRPAATVQNTAMRHFLGLNNVEWDEALIAQ